MSLVEILKDKCNLSFSCVRACPVNAIEIKGNTSYAKILPNRCINCGSCISACPAEAIVYKDSTQIAKEILTSEHTAVAIVDPSISGEFSDITDYRKFVQMIKSLGFSYVHEVSFGADLVALKYASLFKNFKGKYYLTANCPAVVSLIEKYHPELIENLAPIASPMIATSKVVHHIHGKNIKVVYMGPCVDTKEEALRYKGTDGEIHAVLTFVELRKLFQEFGIHESTMEYSDFDPPIGYKGSLYPISNGFLQSIDVNEELLTGNIVTAEGKSDVLEAVKEFETRIEEINRHFNVFYCEGCLMGPGTSPGKEKFLRRSLVIQYANKRLKDFDLNAWKEDIKRFKHLDLSATFRNKDQRLPSPPEEKIQEILKFVGKDTKNHHVGCEACGYPSCRDFAIAVSNGLAKTDMCLTFSLKNRQEYIKTLKLTNEKLAKTQEALKESERTARKEKETAKEASEIMQSMMQKLPSSVVVIDKDMKILLSNEGFIQMLGDDAHEINEIIPGLVGADLKSLLPYNFYNLFSYVISDKEDILSRDVHYNERILNVSVFNIKQGKIVGAVIRDMDVPEVRKEQVIKRVTEAIDKNLEMVQKIGFLLGEGASETEQMLNSILEFHKLDKKGPKNS